MIDISLAKNMAKKLNSEAERIDEVLNDYQKAYEELNKNDSKSINTYKEELQKNINNLKQYKTSLVKISSLVKIKAQKIREEELEELEEKQ